LITGYLDERGELLLNIDRLSHQEAPMDRGSHWVCKSAGESRGSYPLGQFNLLFQCL